MLNWHFNIKTAILLKWISESCTLHVPSWWIIILKFDTAVLRRFTPPPLVYTTANDTAPIHNYNSEIWQVGRVGVM